MRRSLAFVIPVLFTVATSCAQSVNTAQEAQALLDTDRAWAKLADAGASPDSILSFWTDDARVIMPGQPVLVGKDALRGMVTAMLAIPGFHISWTPDSAAVSAAGEWGYTYGVNHISAPDSTGRVTTTEGRYVTVWRKESDGRWRCFVDTFNQGPASPRGSPQ